jgi:hypothetical protein
MIAHFGQMFDPADAEEKLDEIESALNEKLKLGLIEDKSPTGVDH